MEKLHERDVLHRDISRYNIMLGTKTNEFGERRGLLIDYDFAIYPSDRYEESPCTVVSGHFRLFCRRGAYRETSSKGTLLFMARDFLCRWRSRPRMHKYYHDLESLFYVICYVFTTSAGPEYAFRENLDSVMDNLVVGDWCRFAHEDWGHMGSLKSIYCESEKRFERVIDEFTEYFKEDALRKCMRDLRELVFDEGNTWGSARELRDEDAPIGVKYIDVDDREPKEYFREFKRILQEAYDNLEETKSMSQQKELNKNPCDGQEQVLPESADVGTQESQNDGHAPENGVVDMTGKPHVEAPVNGTDVGMGDASRPVSEMANPTSSALNPKHENEAIPNPNDNKKRKRSGDTQEGSESPPPKRDASVKENVIDKNVGNVNVNGAEKSPHSQNGELERRDIPQPDRRSLKMLLTRPR
jgi:serine/threonine protein kinase